MKKPTLRQTLIIIAVSIAVLSLSWFIWDQIRQKIPEGLIVASGRIEGREVTIAPKIQGRVKSPLVDESDTVKRGQLLAEIVSDQLEARYLNARESVSLSKAQVEQATVDLGFTIKDAAAAINAAEAAVKAARAQLEKTRAVLEKTRRDFERYSSLFQEQLVSASDFDRVRMNHETSLADVNVAEKELQRAEANLEAALAAKDIVNIKRSHLQGAEANYKAAVARMQEVYADLQETKIYAPADGTILSRPVEVGEIVNPGTPLYVMVDMDKLYLKVYIPEPDIGKIRLGNEVRVFVDAFPDKAFKGNITKIYEQAEFTPKAVETREERVKLVFGVEVSVENPERLLKPGMPGDAVIRWKEGTPWTKPR
ncbi:MAG TPA: HlyD family efflux transporter periplasmic adaptor subunit [Proteobacteria bacterium]|nr:HlyD family efflux transporter periplasmic adaptor subunit [Pseudomonadota bacterium]